MKCTPTVSDNPTTYDYSWLVVVYHDDYLLSETDGSVIAGIRIVTVK